MGTRSFVGVMKGNVCSAVYVHYDGYLSGVGADLLNYTRQELVEELVSYGDRSALAGPYYKDRGETGVNPVTYNSFAEFYNDAKDADAEYYYIFKDGVWYCGDTYSSTPLSGKLTSLKEALNKEHA